MDLAPARRVGISPLPGSRAKILKPWEASQAQNRPGRYRAAAADQTVAHPPAGPRGARRARTETGQAEVCRAGSHDDSVPSLAGEGGTGVESEATR